MDPKDDTPMFLAPGASFGASRMRLPAECEWPPVDDYLDEPEVTRYERPGGRRVLASPATAEHGDPHFLLDKVLGPHLAEGYVGSVDLKTRVDTKREFASDTCVRKSGIDPGTGKRYLEELVFEVVYKRSADETKQRAQSFAARGVRRQIAIFVRERKVCEWSTTGNGWRTLDPRRSLRDSCLVRPLPIRALFDGALAEIAVARALEAKDNPAIVEMKRESEARGEALGHARSLLTILDERGLSLSDATRARILATSDPETIERWLRRAITASSIDDVLGADSEP
jgi:hypothetical protein